MRSVARVVRTYYAIAGTYTLAASLVWGVNTLFLLHAGLDIFEVFVANTAYTVGTALFEVPTGVFADTLGRRASFLLGVLVLLVTTLGYVGVAQIGGGVLAFSAMSVLVGLGFTFFSGATEAWLVDALQDAGFDGPLDPILARGSMVTGWAMGIGAIGGGALGAIDLSWPYVARALLLTVAFALAWAWMVDRGFTPRALALREVPTEMARVARESVSLAVRARPTRFVLAGHVVEWSVLMWAWYAWQPHLLALWGDPRAIWLAGAISAAMSLATIAGNGIVDRAARVCGRRTTILAWAMLAQVGFALAVGLSTSFWPATLAFLGLVATVGVTGPVRNTTLHALATHETRASLLSLDSMVASGGSIGGQLGLGWVSRAASIPAGFLVGAGMLALGLPFVAAQRALRDPSDRLGPTPAREPAACAAQGAPVIGQLDA